ncbi:chromatin remodeling factor18 [Striga asiatica]|uniref:Chromatin remodeling factor18 n=1 Tax=Striga asiatica TaxID=4170 RepID=A0A5A7QAW6_STRAF|nr:chromatin remodeling factor18 [Striga asiatica]
MDDWGDISAEELDALERDALRQLAERNNSSSAATTSNNRSNDTKAFSFPANVPSSRSPAKPTFHTKNLAERDSSSSAAAIARNSRGISPKLSYPPEYGNSCRSPAKATSHSRPPVDDDKARALPSSIVPHAIDDPPKQQLQKVIVKFFLHATGNIAAKFPYDKVLLGAFHNIPRASWNSKERLWMFPMSSLSTAESVLRDVPNSYVEIENLDPLVRRAIAAATSIPDLQGKFVSSVCCQLIGMIKFPQVLKQSSCLFNVMVSGNIELEFANLALFRFVLQHGGRALLADEMGLGKTLQAIAVASCIREAWPVLILTPSSLRLHWASVSELVGIPLPRNGCAFTLKSAVFMQMIQQWLNIAPSDILVVLSQWCGSNRSGFNIVPSNTKRPVNLDGLFNIISYDIVPKLQDTLLASNFKVVIADESHFLKNGQAKRTNASLPILQKSLFCTNLSQRLAEASLGIAILKANSNQFLLRISSQKKSFLEALYPNVYSNVHDYGNRYCKGGIFGLYQGASNHEELHNLIKATLMIRRLKKDVLSELPVKRRQQEQLPSSSLFKYNMLCLVFLELKDEDMRQINALFRELEVVKGKIKACQSKEEAESLKFTEKNLINKIYTESAEAKIPAVLDYLGTIIEAGCKFLIFAHHQPMIDSIHKFLQKKKVGCIRIDGSTPAASRQSLVTEFQEKDSVKAAVLSIKAGGVGLTLTAASTVIFAELSWTPGDMIQAEDRAHRIGQVSSVNIYYLLANDTVDDIIWDVIQNKLENLGQMLDGHENSLEVSADLPQSSPMKQKTLDNYVKRCSTSYFDEEPKHKYPRN